MGGSSFSSHMISTASDEGLLAVYQDSCVYHVQPPKDGTLLCHLTGQRVQAVTGVILRRKQRNWWLLRNMKQIPELMCATVRMRPRVLGGVHAARQYVWCMLCWFVHLW